MKLELVYTKASDNYIIVNHDKKIYCLVAVKYKTYFEIENILEMEITQRFDNMKDFKKTFKGYK